MSGLKLANATKLEIKSIKEIRKNYKKKIWKRRYDQGAQLETSALRCELMQLQNERHSLRTESLALKREIQILRASIQDAAYQ